MVDALNNFTINDAEYYESNTSTTSDAQGDFTRNTERVTHTSNGNETVNQTGNGYFEQKLFSNRTIHVLSPAMKLVVDQVIAPIILAPQTLLAPATKEVVTDAASGGAWKNRTPRRVSRTGVYGSTPGNIHYAVRAVEPPSPVLIVIFGTSPPCGLNVIHQVATKRESTSTGLVGKPKNWTLSLTVSCPVILILCPFSAS